MEKFLFVPSGEGSSNSGSEETRTSKGRRRRLGETPLEPDTSCSALHDCRERSSSAKRGKTIRVPEPLAVAPGDGVAYGRGRRVSTRGMAGEELRDDDSKAEAEQSMDGRYVS